MESRYGHDISPIETYFNAPIVKKSPKKFKKIKFNPDYCQGGVFEDDHFVY
jgi:hypothetical protein